MNEDSVKVMPSRGRFIATEDQVRDDLCTCHDWYIYREGTPPSQQSGFVNDYLVAIIEGGTVYEKEEL